MNLLSESISEALEGMKAVAGVEVTIAGVAYTALSIQLDQETLVPDFEEKQTSSVQLSASDFPNGLSGKLEIAEVESGTVHVVSSIKYRGLDYLCKCEVRKARVFKGPFK